MLLATHTAYILYNFQILFRLKFLYSTVAQLNWDSNLQSLYVICASQFLSSKWQINEVQKVKKIQTFLNSLSQ